MANEQMPQKKISKFLGNVTKNMRLFKILIKLV